MDGIDGTSDNIAKNRLTALRDESYRIDTFCVCLYMKALRAI
jgi:hypothetical protein